jgi:hypothetical protein
VGVTRGVEEPDALVEIGFVGASVLFDSSEELVLFIKQQPEESAKTFHEARLSRTDRPISSREIF